MKRLLIIISIVVCSHPAGAQTPCTVPSSGIYIVCNTMSGTVHVINGSTAITGSGTAFSATSYIHGTMCVLGGGGVCQQLATCTSSTACTFASNYTGTTNTTATFEMAQVCFPAFNTTNTCTFPSNIASNVNHILWSLAIIDLQTTSLSSYNDGAGNALTTSSNTPCNSSNSPASRSWMAYTLNAVPAGGPTATIVFTNSPTDNVDDIWGAEMAVAGGTASVDTSSPQCTWTTTSANPAGTITLTQASGEFAVFGAYMAGTATAVVSPWTMGSIDTSTGTFMAFDPATSGSSINMGYTPTLQGTGVNVGMAFEFTGSGAVQTFTMGGNAIAGGKAATN